MFYAREPSRRPLLQLAPMIDVVFLLLIFFMVSTTFQRETELSVQLPKANAEESEAQPESIEIVINQRGQYFLNGRELVNTQSQTTPTRRRNSRESAFRPTGTSCSSIFRCAA